MGRASTLTKLPLATWAKISGIHPLHFEGVVLPNAPDTRRECGSAWPQYTWQAADEVSREDLARAIGQAEADLESYLGYRLAPTWEVDEWRPTDRTNRPELVNYAAINVRGYGQTVTTKWGHFISGGIRSRVLQAAAQAIVWSDADSDGYDETGTVTAAVGSDVLACEIRVFVPGTSGDDASEIRPITASVAAGVATITFRRELCVLSELLDAFDYEAIIGTDDASFLSTVDVYRDRNDSSTSATLLWEPLPGCGGCASDGCTECLYSAQTGCLLARDPLTGIVMYRPATWSDDDDAFSVVPLAVDRQPDIVRLYYRSGLQDKRLACPYRDMDPEWARIVSVYAMALMDRPPCQCSTAEWERWAADLAYTSGATELASYSLAPGDLDNPFGTRRGAVWAWRRVTRDRSGTIGSGAVLT